jgi:hypothetical protein
MKSIARRFTAAGVALVTIYILAWWGLIGSGILTRYVFFHLTPNLPLSKVGGPHMTVSATVFSIFCGAILLVSGIAMFLLVVIPRPGFRIRGIIYVLFLAVILPATAYNYDQGDAVVRPPVQVGLNLLLIFLAATVAYWLNGASTTAIDIRVLKHLGVFLLLTVGVIVPGLFTTLWALWSLHVLNHDALQSVTIQSLTSFASVASAIIAWLNYKREVRKEQRQEPTSFVIDK